MAAIDTLQTRGYSRLRTSSVARQSGLSEGTLFYYFPTKYALVAAATERVLAEYLERAAIAYEHLTLPIDRRQMLEMLWDLLSDQRLNWTHELFAAVRGDPKLQAAVGPIITASATILDEAALAIMKSVGAIPEDQCREAVELIIWSMQGLVSRDMAQGKSGLETELIDYLVYLSETVHPATGAPTG